TRLTPTLHGFEVTVALARGEFVPGPLDRALHPSVLLDPLTGAQGSHFRDYPVLAQFATTLEREQASWPERITRLREAGAQILVGTDAPLPGVLPGSGYHSEIRALSRAGVPTEEIFAGATWGAATLLQPSPDFGAVREGLRADLVLVEGDPLADPSRSADLAEVFVSGRRVERTPLD
ncbi:MAG TPA: hypothetical protein ENK57_04775, partial [Polyangiaceae bacterium]|nr:hypothetical protein [Polyangiaceae bacterium]